MEPVDEQVAERGEHTPAVLEWSARRVATLAVGIRLVRARDDDEQLLDPRVRRGARARQWHALGSAARSGRTVLEIARDRNGVAKPAVADLHRGVACRRRQDRRAPEYRHHGAGEDEVVRGGGIYDAGGVDRYLAVATVVQRQGSDS